MKLTPYQKACRYVNLAKVSEGLDGHGFEQHILSLSAAIDKHRQLIVSRTTAASRSRISERLKYVDSHLCLCSYWMLIAGHLFEPPVGAFGSWNSITKVDSMKFPSIKFITLEENLNLVLAEPLPY